MTPTPVNLFRSKESTLRAELPDLLLEITILLKEERYVTTE